MSKVEVRRHLDRAEVLDVFDLVDAAARHDGVTPLSEHVLMHVRHGGDDDVRHLLHHDDDGGLSGYGHIDVTDSVEGPSAEVVVSPTARRHGIGRSLVDEALRVSNAEAPGLGLRLWAHGESASAHELAESMAFTRTRILWQMRRSLVTPLPDVAVPPGITLRSFLPSIDDADWLAVNQAAFIDLPDQGSWSAQDLHRRMAEDWFDPTGFVVATDEHGRLAGFHWTKVHGGDHATGDGDHARLHAEGVHHAHEHGHQELGEVYVIGVAPHWQGTGLGRALLVAGLRHLASRGLPQAMLYVDASNTAAIGLYASLGFTHWDTDVLYRRT